MFAMLFATTLSNIVLLHSDGVTERATGFLESDTLSEQAHKVNKIKGSTAKF
jgi:hypothetical protein